MAMPVTLFSTDRATILKKEVMARSDWVNPYSSEMGDTADEKA
jgi:hypothetical protein